MSGFYDQLDLKPLRRYRLRNGGLVQLIKIVERANAAGPFWQAINLYGGELMTFNLNGRAVSDVQESALDIIRRER